MMTQAWQVGIMPPSFKGRDMNIREGTKRILVVMSVVSVVMALVATADNLRESEPSAYFSRQDLAECLRSRAGLPDPQVQFAPSNGKPLLLVDGREPNPFDLLGPSCGKEAAGFMDEAEQVMTYRQVGPLKYNAFHRQALNPLALCAAWLAFLWVGFYAIAWIGSGFVSKKK